MSVHKKNAGCVQKKPCLGRNVNFNLQILQLTSVVLQQATSFSLLRGTMFPVFLLFLMDFSALYARALHCSGDYHSKEDER
uniref:Uncharacterized protein n=1 Tax=Romanomermis culicivorax TaxID=13658 RepID=A0A915KTI1_ROMCU